jgi:hypothetical protein
MISLIYMTDNHGGIRRSVSHRREARGSDGCRERGDKGLLRSDRSYLVKIKACLENTEAFLEETEACLER